MQNNFDKHIEKKLENFSLEPSSSVWTEVEKSLSNNKKRRPFIFWLFASFTLVLVLVVGVHKVANKNFITSASTHQNNKTIQPISESTSEFNNGNEILSIDKNDGIITTGERKSFKVIKKNANEYANNKAKVKLKVQKQNQDYKIVNTSVEPENNGQSSNESLNTNYPTQVIEGITNKNIVDNDTSNKLFSDTISIKKTEQAKIIIEQDIISIPIQIKDIQTPSILYSSELLLPTSKAKKHTSFNYFIGGGLSFSKMSNNKTAMVASSTSSGGGIIGGGTIGAGGGTVGSGGSGTITPATNKLTLPSTGFNIVVGIGYKKSISKSVAWHNNLQYQYTSINQLVGNDTAVLMDRAIFISGTNTTIKNSMHTIGIESFLAYTLNHTSKKPLFIIFGAQMQINVANKWLFTDYAKQQFYYNDAIKRSLFLNGLIGLQYAITSNNALQIQWLPSASSIHKSSSNNLLQQVQLRFISGFK